MPPRASATRPSSPFCLGRGQQHPEEESSPVRGAAATSDLPACAASRSPPPPPRPSLQGRRLAPGVRARAPVCECARPTSLGPAAPPGAGPPRDPRPRAASHVPRRRRAASRAPRRAVQEDGGIGGGQRCRGGECGGVHARRPLPAAPHAAACSAGLRRRGG